jgi:hypothetical protein
VTGTEILLEIALPRRPARWLQPASIAADSASAGCCCPGAAKMPSYGSDAKPKANHELGGQQVFLPGHSDMPVVWPQPQVPRDRAFEARPAQCCPE